MSFAHSTILLYRCFGALTGWRIEASFKNDISRDEKTLLLAEPLSEAAKSDRDLTLICDRPSPLLMCTKELASDSSWNALGVSVICSSFSLNLCESLSKSSNASNESCWLLGLELTAVCGCFQSMQAVVIE